MMGSETYDIITELIDSFLQRHQEGLDKSERNESKFVFDGVGLLS